MRNVKFLKINSTHVENLHEMELQYFSKEDEILKSILYVTKLFKNTRR